VLKRTNTKDVFDRLMESAESSDDGESDIDADTSESPDASINSATIGVPGSDAELEPGEGELVTSDESGGAAEAKEVKLKGDLSDEHEVDDEFDSDDLAASDDDAGTPAKSRRRRILRTASIVVICLVFVAALGLSAFMGWQLKKRNDVAEASRAAMDTAKSYAVTLSSIDSKTVDQNFTQVLDGATGEFKDMYSQSSAQLRQLLIDNKAISRGVVVDAGIKSATDDKVEVLLFIDQSISNSVTPDPRIDRLRMTMTMERVDHRWLASHIDIT
jgi:Mce-associated membrane protein